VLIAHALSILLEKKANGITLFLGDFQ
jgi:hypothetical protein